MYLLVSSPPLRYLLSSPLTAHDTRAPEHQLGYSLTDPPIPRKVETLHEALFDRGERPCSQAEKLGNSPRILLRKERKVKERLEPGKANRKPRSDRGIGTMMKRELALAG
jgi:hypothetical protein